MFRIGDSNLLNEKIKFDELVIKLFKSKGFEFSGITLPILKKYTRKNFSKTSLGKNFSGNKDSELFQSMFR